MLPVIDPPLGAPFGAAFIAKELRCYDPSIDHLCLMQFFTGKHAKKSDAPGGIVPAAVAYPIEDYAKLPVHKSVVLF